MLDKIALFHVSIINPQSLTDFLFVPHVGCGKYQYKEKRGNLLCLPCGENSSSFKNGYRFCSCKKQHFRARAAMKNSSADCYSKCFVLTFVLGTLSQLETGKS